MSLRLLPIGLAAALLASCATIWGFEDALDLEADGGASSGSSGSSGATGEVTPSDTPGIVCAPAAPEGWQGPLAIFAATATPLPPLPPCTDRYQIAYDGNAQPDARPGACTCACDPPGSFKCGAPRLSFFIDDQCATPCGPSTQPVPSTCAAFDAGTCPSSKWAKVTNAVPVGVTCTARVVGEPPAVAWGAEVRLCAPAPDVAATRCPGGKAPTPEAVLPYEPSNYCIASRTATSCPAGYPAKRTYYDPDKLNDTRRCKDCTCGTPEAPCGGMVITADNPTACSGGTQPINLPAACATTKSSNEGFIYREPDGGGGPVTCPPAGGGAEGTLAPTAPITVCCRN